MNKETKNKRTSFNFLQKIKENKPLKYCIIVILVIILLVIAIPWSSKTSNQTLTVNEYVYTLENKLETILSNIEGVGKVNVAITVDGGTETVIAMKKTSNENSGKITTEETPIIVNGKTVVLKELNPNVTGVLIVAEGAENISTLRKIQQATTSLLGVNINLVEILSM